ncbi:MULTISPECIES: hypothetical protein [unclassified Pseudomonas]|uniref:hypothetical protein n=1 Tax=unclassified Pseudomonas TaxID=196821 RepID=UPI0024493B83|nr:hypothetical protein [Pseudomonas sp. GD03944]MDH1265851.1 hypothetical protein [Pseudomonas sp. GD03944]
MGRECKACGATVMNGLEACPACGTRLSNKVTYLRLAALAMIVVLVAKAYLDKPAETDTAPAAPASAAEQ